MATPTCGPERVDDGLATGRQARMIAVVTSARSRSARWSIAGLALATSGCVITGSVFVDRNRDGVRQRGEPGVPRAVVSLDGRAFTITDRSGGYAFDGARSGDVVWVRVPDGFRPGPVWAPASSARIAELPLVALTDDETRSPLTFVVGADTHVTTDPADPWAPGELTDIFAQATSQPDPPRFLTVVGDMTQGTRVEQFERLHRGIESLSVPWVPVPGNHDWYDGGFNYRDFYGPDQYSFDIGHVHFVVWDTNRSPADQIAFFAADLARVEPSMVVVALGHESPSDEVATALDELDVDYLFTGHWHASRALARGEVLEWGTQPMIMGGIDASPAGYRVVNLDGPVPLIEHRERLVRPQLALVSPHPGSCVSPSGAELIAAVALDGATPAVHARVDCGAAQALTPSGGWNFRGELPPLAPGPHTLELQAVAPSGQREQRSLGFTVCEPAPTTPAVGAWPQLGGGPAHTGARAEPLTLPLTVRWTTSVGQAVSYGAPVVADGVVVVTLTDRGDGDHGGVVALDLATGVERWRHIDGSVANAAAIADGVVVFGKTTGVVEALDLATGARRWTYDLGAGLPTGATSLWAAPTIADGVVHVAVQGRIAALDLVTGQPRWTREPTVGLAWLGTHAAITVAGGAALVALNRDLGVTSWSAATGAERWANVSSATVAVYAAPLVVAGTAYVLNARGDLSALDLATGSQRWTTALTPGGFDWGYSIVATPAYADGTLFVTTQWSQLIAVDAASGAVRWQVGARGGPLNTAHYRAAQAGFVNGPVVTGALVWAGHPDGTLVAYDTATGAERFVTSLGAPILSAPTPAGDHLIVATYDGTVRALTPSTPPTVMAPMECPPWVAPEVADGGCCATTHRPTGSDGLLLALVGYGLLRRRRRAARR